jgi:hypothetical protein
LLLKTFVWSLGATVIAFAGTLIVGGPTALAIVAILSILEISLSFDNAVVNATVLERMSAFWQKIFLTVGIAIAVFGMRLLFPLLIVSITAGLGPVEAVKLALEGGSGPGSYADLLSQAHPEIAAFGGMFLLMLFLDWTFEEREIVWLRWLEVPLAKIGKLDTLSVVVSLCALCAAAEFLADNIGSVMVAGALGIASYLAVNGLGNLFEAEGAEIADDIAAADSTEIAGGPGFAEADGSDAEVVGSGGRQPGRSGRGSVVKATGQAAFFLFLYLEVLDASFSFDGVIGAFAITQDIILIAVGLGVGAMYIRSLTVFLVRKGTLNDYVYLEHGAHWAIGALAVILLVSMRFEVPEIVTGLVGVGFIGLAFGNSLVRNRRLDRDAAQTPQAVSAH